MELTDALRNHIGARLEKMKRHMDMIAEALIVLSVEKHRHKVEVTLKGKRSAVSGMEVTDDMYQSIDGVFDKIEKQLRRKKDRRLAKRTDRGDEPSPEIADLPEPELDNTITASEIVKNELGNTIVEMEEVNAADMPIEEALLHFEGKPGTIFVFRENSYFNVLFRRNDGKVGLIKAK